MIPKQEDQHIEFKSSFSDKVIIGLVAFANAKGGTVYIGVDDDGIVVGVRLGKETIAQWINEVKSKTEPSIIPDVEIKEEKGKTIVMLSVQEYPVKPVSVRGKYYCRRQNSNHLLSAGEIADMSLQTRNSSWDYYLDPLHTIADLNLNLVQKSINQMNRRGMNITESPKDYIMKKGLCHPDGHLTFGGYLLFKQEEDILTTIELGHFQDKEGILIKDSARSKSSLVEQVEEVMQFVKKHINMAVIITPNQVENIQKWDYPLDAIREIVLNMIIHRDYRSAADSIVKIFPDRMEFYNPGRLPEGLEVADLLSNHYRSQPRNKQIADVFKDMGEIEKYGSGIGRVVRAFLEEGHPAPEWQQISGGILVTVYRGDGANSSGSEVSVAENGEKPTNTTKKSTNTIEENVTSVGKTVGKTVGETVGKTVGKTAETILKLIIDNPKITKPEMARLTGLSLRGVEWNVQQLKSSGLIARIGPNKGGHWEVRPLD